MSLEDFNALNEADARHQLELCCVSGRWIEGLLEARPFPSPRALRQRADAVWAELEREDILEAFEGHPKIGDVNSLRARFASSGALAAHEQSGVACADESVLERLAAGNRAYEQRFGYIFIVCASGKSAQEMCELLESRLHNSPDKELQIAAEEQRKILQLRLEKLL